MDGLTPVLLVLVATRKQNVGDAGGGGKAVGKVRSNRAKLLLETTEEDGAGKHANKG